MTITYALFENPLMNEENACRALVHARGTAELGDVIERIVQQGSTVTRADIVSVLENYHHTIESLLLEGMNVKTPIANFRVGIRGIFAGHSDVFDHARHQVRASASPGRRLRAAVRKRARPVKQQPVTPAPNPQEYTDLNTGEINAIITPGGMGRLIGGRLKFDTTDPLQGIYIIGLWGERRVDVVGHNWPGELMFLDPTGLPAGDCRLEVRSEFSEGSIRTGDLNKLLRIA